jgi:Leucine-rich repeat (LRR) protein
MSGIREFAIFHLKKLKVLDGIGIEPQETKNAKAMFAGRLTEEILEQRLQGLTTDNVKKLDLSNTKLRDFEDVFTNKTYPKLTDLNVSQNHLTSLNSFGSLPTLRILQLANNRLETLFCKHWE